MKGEALTGHASHSMIKHLPGGVGIFDLVP